MGDHRVERALERYGVALSERDIGAIAALAKPCNCVRKRENGSAIHVIVWGKVPLITAIRQCDIGPVVATFLPADALTAGHHRRWLQSGPQRRRGKKL